jgi:hypothetical protein
MESRKRNTRTKKDSQRKELKIKRERKALIILRRTKPLPVSAYVPTNYFSDQLPLLKLTLQSHGR